MRTRPRLALVLAFLLAAPAAALGCGYCVEDKIASVYDHAVVTRALADRLHVVYFHLDGPLGNSARARKAIEAAAASTAGVDKGSVRVNVETLTLSLAFDPVRTPLARLQNALEKKLAARKLTLMPLRILETPGDLASLRRY
jgi:hypothetical protein